MSSNNTIEIDKNLFPKLKQVSKTIGLSLNEIINIQVKKFLTAIKQDPISELEYLGFRTKLTKIFE